MRQMTRRLSARRSAVEEAGSKNSFCLEVTEEAALERFGKIAENLHDLFGHGILAAIDDFSMGQTSLKYLQGSNFQFVKLDGALVRQLLDSPRSQDIVRAIVGLGQDLNFQVVAEYVESQELRDLLLSLNCRIFQGYLYSPAVHPPSWSALCWIGTARGSVRWPGHKSAPFPAQRVVGKFRFQSPLSWSQDRIGADRAAHQHVLLKVHGQAVGVEYMF